MDIFLVFSMEAVFQDLHSQNVTGLTKHTAQQLEIKFHDLACFERTLRTKIAYQGDLTVV